MMKIDELIIRLPGSVHEEGNHLLGREVAQRVAAAWPEGIKSNRIPELKIRLVAPTENGTAAMADAIAQQIIRQIRQLNF